MHKIKLKVSAELLALAVVAVLISIAIFSHENSELQAQKVNASERTSTFASSAKTVLPTSSPVSSAASSSPVSATPFTEQLKNTVVKDPVKLKSSICSPNAVLVSLKDHTILLDKNASQRIYPASMTKIMTVLVAIEELKYLNEEICIPNALIDQMNAQDASMAGFESGENVRAIDLLYGAVLPSGAECCISLANHLEGSEQNFVAKMNQKAVELGLKNTHFMNTTGLHNANHYTTVKELASLLSYALQNPTFRQIFTTPSYTTPPTNKHPDGLSFRSTMFRNLDSATVGAARLLGGKVGYTDEAGLCLASLASVNGKEYILVTAGVKDMYKGEIKDAVTVYGSLGK